MTASRCGRSSSPRPDRRRWRSIGRCDGRGDPSTGGGRRSPGRRGRRSGRVGAGAASRTRWRSTLVRAVADGSAVVAFGLAAVPMLDIDRYRGELIRRATGPLTIAGAIWLVAELLRLGRGSRAGRGGSGLAARRAHRGRLRPAHGAGTVGAVQRGGRGAGVCDRRSGAAFGVDERRGRGSRRCRSGGASTHRPSLRECARRDGRGRAHPGGGAVVRRAGGARAHGRAPRPVGPGAAEVLAAVAGVCGGTAGGRRARRRS